MFFFLQQTVWYNNYGADRVLTRSLDVWRPTVVKKTACRTRLKTDRRRALCIINVRSVYSEEQDVPLANPSGTRPAAVFITLCDVTTIDVLRVD